MDSFFYYPKVHQRSNTTPIKLMFAVFADPWQSYEATFCTKASLLEML